MTEFCLVCAAKGFLVEAVHPMKCHLTGNCPPQCPVCRESTALVNSNIANDVRSAFAEASGLADLVRID